MTLPPYVRYCLDTLEQAGFPAYVVGGCVRDACLGLEPQDFDVCTAALPEQTEALFSPHRLILAGKKHGTVAVVLEGIVEITTFRSEGGYDDHRHPGWVRFQPDVESDLARRDFTVNAMAFSPTRGLADPFGGGADLKSKTLRAVGDPETRFREDALRILRGVRFAVKYGLTVEENTLRAMERQAFSLNDLARERVFEELCKLLPLVNAEDLLRFAPILAAAIPELKPTMGFDQRTPHHVYDVFTHIAHVVEGVGPDLPSRWAALLHDVGKPAAFTMDENGRGHFKGHAPISAAMAGDILLRLKAPTALREQVIFLVEHHMTKLEPDKKVLRRWLSRYGGEAVELLLRLQEADMAGKGVDEPIAMEQFPVLRRLIGEILEEDSCLSLRDLAVNGHDLMALGLTGKAIGQTLNRLLNLVLEEVLPNTREALLSWIKKETEQ